MLAKLLLSLCLSINPSFRSVSVFGKEENNTDNDDFHRHIAEAGFKPAIFGSHAYDPIKNCFDVKKITEKDEGEGQESTKLITDENTSPQTPAMPEAPEAPEGQSPPPPSPPESPAGDQDATPTPGDKSLRDGPRSTFWWARAKDSYQNLTHYLKNAII